MLTWVPPPTEASWAVIVIAAWPRPFCVGAGGVDDHPLGRVVALEDLGLAVERQLHRTHPDADGAGVVVVAEVVGELGAGQAGRHLRDVAEELPDLVQRAGRTSNWFLISTGSGLRFGEVARRVGRERLASSRRSRSSTSSRRARRGSARRRRSRSSRTPGRPPRDRGRLRRPARRPGGRGQLAGGPALHELGEHRDRDLLVAGAAEVEPDRGADPVEEVLRDAALGEVGEHRLPALARGDQADERRGRGRPRGVTASSSPWPWVAITTIERSVRSAAESSAGSMTRLFQPRVPASSARVWVIGERAHDDQVEGRDDGFDVDLHGALALARHRDVEHPLGQSATGARRRCRGTAAAARGSRSRARPRGARPARRTRRR